MIRLLGRVGLFAALLSLSAARCAWSAQPPLDSGVQSLSTFLPYGVPTNPLHEGVLELQVAPGYLTYGGYCSGGDTGSQGGYENGCNKTNIHGWGAGGSLVYGFSDHWGVSIIMSGSNLSGTRNFDAGNNGKVEGIPFSSPKTTSSPDPTQGSKESGTGFMSSANLIWDFRSGDGFRLPIFVGVSYTDVTETADQQTVGLKRQGIMRSVGISGGIVPQFNVWKFRFAPFIVESYAFGHATGSITDYNPSNGAVNRSANFTFSGNGNANYQQVSTLGITVTYRPLGLGFTYVPPISTQGYSAYTLKFSHHWGGKPNGAGT